MQHFGIDEGKAYDYAHMPNLTNNCNSSPRIYPSQTLLRQGRMSWGRKLTAPIFSILGVMTVISPLNVLRSYRLLVDRCGNPRSSLASDSEYFDMRATMYLFERGGFLLANRILAILSSKIHFSFIFDISSYFSYFSLSSTDNTIPFYRNVHIY